MIRRCSVLLLLCYATLVDADWFLNKEQQAAENYQQGLYEEAAEGFQDPYRRGVANYRTGDYESAIEEFKQVEREEVKLDAQYNLGNSHYRMEAFEQAVKAYESVLQEDPDHQDARHNLALARDKLEQEQEEEKGEE
ncbi:MAG: tetratricopeptide repeat protein, partial [Candidatus Thiodiazotropha taylori]|nr:tetratricopeptide repeat protein [Candidatus Thiodiazotropha taylori]